VAVIGHRSAVVQQKRQGIATVANKETTKRRNDVREKTKTPARACDVNDYAKRNSDLLINPDHYFGGLMMTARFISMYPYERTRCAMLCGSREKTNKRETVASLPTFG